MAISFLDILTFLFAVFVTLGIVPSCRMIVSKLAGKETMAPVAKSLEGGAVALLLSVTMAVFYSTEGIGRYNGLLGAVITAFIVISAIRYTRVGRDLHPKLRLLAEQSFLLFIIAVLLGQGLGVDLTSLTGLFFVGFLAYFVSATGRFGIWSDSRESLASGFLIAVMMIGVALLATVIPTDGLMPYAYFLQIREVSVAVQGALVAIFFYSVATHWRSSPSLRIGVIGHMTLGLFVCWMSLLLLIKSGNSASVAVSLVWILSTPLNWWLYTRLSGRVSRVDSSQFFWLATTCLSISVGLALALYQVQWLIGLVALVPAFLLLYVGAGYFDGPADDQAQNAAENWARAKSVKSSG